MVAAARHRLFPWPFGAAVFLPLLAACAQQLSPLSSYSPIPVRHGWHHLTAVDGWLVPDGERLLRTHDGGQSWTSVRPPGQTNFLDTSFFLTPAIGWTAEVVPESESGASREVRIFRTLDGQATWRSATVSIARLTDVLPRPAISLDFTDGKRGWLMVTEGLNSPHHGELFGTADGGATWTDIGRAPGGMIRFLGTMGWSLLGPPESNQLWVTADGGRTWSRLDHPAGAYDQLPLFWSNLDGVLSVERLINPLDEAHYQLQLYLTHDGGQSWLPSGIVGTSFGSHPAVGVLGADLCFVALPQEAKSSALLRSRDSGRTWTRLRPQGLDAPVVEMDFIDPQHGWAVDQPDCGRSLCHVTDGILSTNDGGLTWVRVSLPAPPGALKTADARVVVRFPQS